MGRKKEELPIWAQLGHKKPVTRREFMGYGMIPFAVRALVPGALGLMATSPKAWADGVVCAPPASDIVPFITLNLEGGAGIMANLVPRDASGALLSDMTKMGLGNSVAGNGGGVNLPLASEFGVNSWAGLRNGNLISNMLTGIRQTSTQATRDKTALVSFCVRSRDDSGENRFDASGMAFRAGVIGSMIPNLGSRNNTTGINQQAASISPPVPLRVASFNDVAGSIGYTRSLSDNLTKPQKEKLANLVSKLSAEQSRKFASINSTKQVQDLVTCAGIKNVDLTVLGGAAVDPITQNAGVATVWGITAATAVNNESRVFGTMVYNAIVGNAGTVNLERGGYDYHTGNRTTGNQRDLEAGQVIGRILETAAVLNKKVCLYLTSDGAVQSDSANQTPDTSWTGDRGEAGSAIVFMFDPAGRPATPNGYQVGSFVAAQAADGSSVIGADPETAAQAVFANYLKFAGKLDLFSKILPQSKLTGTVLDGVVKIG